MVSFKALSVKHKFVPLFGYFTISNKHIVSLETAKSRKQKHAATSPSKAKNKQQGMDRNPLKTSAPSYRRKHPVPNPEIISYCPNLKSVWQFRSLSENLLVFGKHSGGNK